MFGRKETRYCARTGEINCKCLASRKLTSVTGIKVDLKMSLRKLFTDHAVYTILVMKALVNKTDDVNVLVPRLLNNQKDIGDQVKAVVGDDNIGSQLTSLLTQHINLAAAVIKAAIAGVPQTTLNNNISELYKNGNEIAAFLSKLNPEKLVYEDIQKMFENHNKFVIDMTVARLARNYAEELKLYDAYYNEILEMSDAIANALI